MLSYAYRYKSNGVFVFDTTALHLVRKQTLSIILKMNNFITLLSLLALVFMLAEVNGRVAVDEEPFSKFPPCVEEFCKFYFVLHNVSPATLTSKYGPQNRSLFAPFYQYAYKMSSRLLNVWRT